MSSGYVVVVQIDGCEDLYLGRRTSQEMHGITPHWRLDRWPWAHQFSAPAEAVAAVVEVQGVAAPHITLVVREVRP